MHNPTTAIPSTQIPHIERVITARRVATGGVVTLLLFAIAIIVGGGLLTEYASAALTLLNGPLIDGPLIDLGDTLNGIQIGQFQQ